MGKKENNMASIIKLPLWLNKLVMTLEDKIKTEVYNRFNPVYHEDGYKRMLHLVIKTLEVELDYYKKKT